MKDHQRAEFTNKLRDTAINTKALSNFVQG